MVVKKQAARGNGKTTGMRPAQKGAGTTGPGILTGTNFERANVATRHRLIVAIDGLEKTGKTNLALTAPGPIAYSNFDIGAEGVLNKFQDDKEIWLADYWLNVDPKRTDNKEVADAARKVWETFVTDFKTVLAKGVRSYIVDTATEAWEVLRLASFGKLDQVMPHHYGKPNAEFRYLLRAAYDSDTNLILLHKMKDEYINDKRTGNAKRVGFGDTAFLTQVNVQTWRDDNEEGMGRFKCTVLDCRQNPDAIGFEMSGPEITFQNIATIVHPETAEKDWQ